MTSWADNAEWLHTASTQYVLAYDGKPHTVLTRKGVMQWRRLMAEHPELRETGMAITKRTVIVSAPLCPQCKARQSVGEWDCDGWYWMASCEHPQCRAGETHRMARDKRNAEKDLDRAFWSFRNHAMDCQTCYTMAGPVSNRHLCNNGVTLREGWYTAHRMWQMYI
jgi:Zn ribbon nucleic-acid-binding protein